MNESTAVLTVGLFFMVVAIIILVLCLFVLPLYILGSLGLMKIAKKQGIQNAWLAWIPIGRDYLLGRMAWDEKAGLIFIMLSGVPWLNFVGLSGTVIMRIAVLAWFICCLVALHKVYEKMSDKAIVMTVFTVLTCGVISPIFLFAIRNNTMITGNTNATETAKEL